MTERAGISGRNASNTGRQSTFDSEVRGGWMLQEQRKLSEKQQGKQRQPPAPVRNTHLMATRMAAADATKVLFEGWCLGFRAVTCAARCFAPIFWICSREGSSVWRLEHTAHVRPLLFYSPRSKKNGSFPEALASLLHNMTYCWRRSYCCCRLYIKYAWFHATYLSLLFGNIGTIVELAFVSEWPLYFRRGWHVVPYGDRSSRGLGRTLRTPQQAAVVP